MIPVIGLHGAPRSGTTWIGQILNSAPETAYRFQPFFAYAFRPRADAARTPQALDALLDAITTTDDDFVLQRGDRRLARRELAFEKTAPTHLVYKEVRYHHLLPQLMQLPRFTGVGIVRNPYDVLSSWVNAPREFDPAWDFAEHWRHAPAKNAGRPEEFYGYEGWKRAALVFREMAAEHPGRFHILDYDAVVRDPLREMAALFGALGLPFGTQVEAFIASSTSSDDGDPYGVFRSGETARGDPRLTPEIRDWIARDLEQSGLASYAA
jgi:hypothetical protein